MILGQAFLPYSQVIPIFETIDSIVRQRDIYFRYLYLELDKRNDF